MPGPVVFRTTGSLSVRPMYRAAIALRPFQFGCVGDFVAASIDAVSKDAATRGLSPRSVRWWCDAVRGFANFLELSGHARDFLGGDLERQVEVLEAWVLWLRQERRVSHVTVRTYWSALVAVGQRLERGLGMVNPFGVLEPPKAGRAQIRVLSKDQAETLLTTIAHYQWPTPFAKHRTLAIVGCMLLAGLRRGEVLELLTGDVNPAEGWIRVRAGKGRYGGKARTAYMPPQLRDILQRYLDARREAKRANPHLVTLLHRDEPCTPTAVKRLFERLTALVGFHVSPHMLRHTYATLLRRAGIADRVSADLMGHESLAMLKRYSHVFEAEYAEESAKLVLDVEL